MTPTLSPTTWFVTGASRGLGLELVRQLLGRGDNVTATTRAPERLAAALGDVGADRLLVVGVDLADPADVATAIGRTAERFGGLDVVVNNAGYGLIGAVEETGDAEARAMFDVHVFGSWNVVRAALPLFRAQKSGHIVNVSSILGLVGLPGWGLYNATKFALEGLSEALAQEVAEFGVRVTVVEPGYFRTDFLTTDSLALPATTRDGYGPIREMTEGHLALQGTQLGDPVQGARAIIALATAGDGPLRQLLGSDAYAYAMAKVDALRADLEAGRELAHTTDFR